MQYYFQKGILSNCLPSLSIGCIIFIMAVNFKLSESGIDVYYQILLKS